MTHLTTWLDSKMIKTSPHHRFLLTLLVVFGLTAASLTGTANAREEKSARVEGRVTASDQNRGTVGPLASAKVYAYEVATYAMVKVLTDRRGQFSFRSLPAGMYQIVAYKDGFAPTIELLLRKDPDSQQFVELHMQDELTASARQAEGYWSVRGRLPADVLRDIGSDHLIPESMIVPGMQLDQTAAFSAAMMADGGVEQLGNGLGDAQITTTQVAVEGTVGSVKVGLQGRLQQLAQVNTTQSDLSALADGEAHSLQLKVQHEDKSTLRVSAGGGQLNGLESSRVEPTHLEHYGVDWRGNAGSNGESRVTARYAEESNLHATGMLAPSEIPEASRTLDVSGQYSGQITTQTSLEAGLTYRQQIGEGGLPSSFGGTSKLIDGALDLFESSARDESFGIFTTAESQIQPKVLIEYGFFSSVRDGSLSLTPHGGLVVQLGDDWKAHTSFSHRIEEDHSADLYEGFRSSFFGDRTNCQQAGEACYEVMFSQGQESRGNSISIGAVHRKFAETLRLYFSPDFFNRLESVFVVEGDSLPEVQFSMVRQISPRVLARLQSNIAAGGGGIFYATDDRAYENEVRYLVTSLDTQFQNTATGIFIAFHHLEQSFNPVDQPTQGIAGPDVEMQRLQLMLTQDLNILVDVASKWAVRLNVELSRGSTPYTLTPDDDLRKKLTGGISVSF